MSTTLGPECSTLNRYAEAQARLEHAGGYGWRERALSTLHGLGFHDDGDLDRPLRTFSGGELTRASLGRALRIMNAIIPKKSDQYSACCGGGSGVYRCAAEKAFEGRRVDADEGD